MLHEVNLAKRILCLIAQIMSNEVNWPIIKLNFFMFGYVDWNFK